MPQHEVSISKAYWIDTTEVTNSAFQAFVENHTPIMQHAMFTLVRILRLLVGVASLPAQAVAAVRLAQTHGHCDWDYDDVKDGQL